MIFFFAWQLFPPIACEVRKKAVAEAFVMDVETAATVMVETLKVVAVVNSPVAEEEETSVKQHHMVVMDLLAAPYAAMMGIRGESNQM